MKIKLKNGLVVDLPLRVAQRYIRLGKGSIIKDMPKTDETVIFREPEIEVKPKRKPRKKVEEIIETETIDEQEHSSEEIQSW